MKKSLLFLFLISSLVVFGQNESRGTIRVVVHGLRNNTGQVGIRVFKQAFGFPTERKNAIKEVFATPIDGMATFEISDWIFGIYAIGAIHDENSNKEFDKNFLGIPREGFGTSNNPKIRFGPPSFKEAAFTFNQSILTLKVKIVYF